MRKTGKQKSFVDYELPPKTLEKVRGGETRMTTLAIGEEGGPVITSKSLGEECGTITTLAQGEEGGSETI